MKYETKGGWIFNEDRNHQIDNSFKEGDINNDLLIINDSYLLYTLIILATNI